MRDQAGMVGEAGERELVKTSGKLALHHLSPLFDSTSTASKHAQDAAEEECPHSKGLGCSRGGAPTLERDWIQQRENARTRKG